MSKEENVGTIFDQTKEIAKFEQWLENDREITGENGIDPVIKKACETVWLAAKLDAWLSPTAANKATEEAELPLWHHNENSKEMHPDPCGEWVRADTARFAIERAVAADRASRQVANKAEVDLDAGFLQWVHDRMRFVHGEDENFDYMHKLRAIIASVPPGSNTPNVASIATPPATTGASTICYGAAKPEQACPCTECKAEVGASTVLTDERIDAAMLKYSTFVTPGAYSLTSFECVEDMRNFAREIAAQAGQVAVPEGWKLVPVEPTLDMVTDGFESAPDEFFSPAEEWDAYAEMTGCQKAAHRAKLCWAAMLAVAPSAPAVAQQAPADEYKPVGKFLFTGWAYEATSSDDPRGITLYRPAQASTPDGRQEGGDRG